MGDPCHPYLLVHTHVPKCGGASFDDAVRGALGGKRYHRRHGPQMPLENLSEEERAEILAIAGHFSWNDPVVKLWPRTPLYFATVRDPVSRLISDYSYRRQSAPDRPDGHPRRRFLDMTLEEHARKILKKPRHRVNVQCDFFDDAGTFEGAKAVIEKHYTLVVQISSLDRMIAMLVKHIAGKEPPARERANVSNSERLQLDPGLAAQLREAMQDDIRLLDWVAAREEAMFAEAAARLAATGDALKARPRLRPIGVERSRATAAA